jgi:glucose-1-phosphate cytidylyltransferase
VQPPGRFGVLNINEQNSVSSFEEKPSDEIGWINGGFFVLEPEVIKYIDGDLISWERQPLTQLAKDGQLSAFHHTGFWQPCDTLRDKRELEALWAADKAPWRIRESR